MGQNDDLNVSLAHIVLGCVASRGISRMSGKTFIHPGMHANFFIHSVLGFLHYQSGILNNDFGQAYKISLLASKYLALPCLNADLYSANKNLSVAHLVSGLLPFALALGGNDNPPLGNLMVAVNIISLCHYSMENKKEWGWYTAACGVFAYFMSRQMSNKIVYPLGLALMEYCAYRLFHNVYDPPPPQRR